MTKCIRIKLPGRRRGHKSSAFLWITKNNPPHQPKMGRVVFTFSFCLWCSMNRIIFCGSPSPAAAAAGTLFMPRPRGCVTIDDALGVRRGRRAEGQEQGQRQNKKVRGMRFMVPPNISSGSGWRAPERRRSRGV
jgi:hypothetical protein